MKKKILKHKKIINPASGLRPPDKIFISVRPIVTYAIDIQRTASDGMPGKPGSWSSFHRIGECADAPSAIQMAEYLAHLEAKKYKDDAPEISVADLTYLVQIEHPPLPGQKKTKGAAALGVGGVFPSFDGVKKAAEGLRKKFIEQGKQAKPLVTINEAKDMLKARKKLAKTIKVNRKAKRT